MITIKFDASDQAAKLLDLQQADTQGAFYDFNLDPEVLTDKDQRKFVPCRRCRRVCVVTTFATPDKTQCNTCRGAGKTERQQEVKQQQAATASAVTIAQLSNLVDGLVNAAFRQIPHCPFDPEHAMELKSITHSPTYGPRRLRGYQGNIPMYDQEVGESVVYQCNDCLATVSFSTMHQLPLRAMNESRDLPPRPADQPTVLAELLGVRN